MASNVACPNPLWMTSPKIINPAEPNTKSPSRLDMTVDDPKAYTKLWTVRVDQRLIVDQDLIEFECNENQQFRHHVK
jgi:hypothetical protein